MKQYLCIKDYHPLINDKGYQIAMSTDPRVVKEVKEHNDSIKRIPTKMAIVKKGDIMTQMGENDSRFSSRDEEHCALYEYTLQNYSDCFEVIK